MSTEDLLVSMMIRVLFIYATPRDQEATYHSFH